MGSIQKQSPLFKHTCICNANIPNLVSQTNPHLNPTLLKCGYDREIGAAIVLESQD